MTIDYAKMEPMELTRSRWELWQEVGRLEEELNRRRSRDRHVMRSSELKWKLAGEHQKMDTQRHPTRTATAVNPELGFNVHNLQAFFAQVPPGTDAGAPYHMHGEAIKYYIQGRGVEIIGDKKYEVQAGDVVFIPAFTWHGTQNPYQEPLHVLAVTQGQTPTSIWPVFKVREDLRV